MSNSRTLTIKNHTVIIVPDQDGSEDVFIGNKSKANYLGYIMPNIEDGTWDCVRMRSDDSYRYGLSLENALSYLLAI